MIIILFCEAKKLHNQKLKTHNFHIFKFDLDVNLTVDLGVDLNIGLIVDLDFGLAVDLGVDLVIPFIY